MSAFRAPTCPRFAHENVRVRSERALPFGVGLADDCRVRSGLPSGTVTFVFTDVEGSTRLLDELGADAYAGVLGEHRRVVREACASLGGAEVDTQGDAFFLAFARAPDALEAAGLITERLRGGPVRVRMGVHTGSPLVTDEGYVGGDVHRAARIAAAGHGGQVLVSSLDGCAGRGAIARPGRASVQGSARARAGVSAGCRGVPAASELVQNESACARDRVSGAGAGARRSGRAVMQGRRASGDVDWSGRDGEDAARSPGGR